MGWIKVKDEMPEQGREVLVWKGGEEGQYGVASLDALGNWSVTGEDDYAPTYWMPLPGPPETDVAITFPDGMKGRVENGCLMFRLDEDKETIAALMQHYITGEPARISGDYYYVTDMKNGISDSHVVTTFLLNRVEATE